MPLLKNPYLPSFELREFRMLDIDHSGTLSKSEVIRIAKKLAVFLFARSLALLPTSTDDSKKMLNTKRFFDFALNDVLKYFDKEDIQDHFLAAMKRAIKSVDIGPLTLKEYSQFCQLKEFDDFDIVYDVITTALDPDHYYCETLEKFSSHLAKIDFWNVIFTKHITQLFGETFPIFFGCLDYKKVMITDQAKDFFIRFLFVTFAYQQRSFILFYSDVDRYVNKILTFSNKDDLLKFYFKKYANSEGLIEQSGATDLFNDIMQTRKIFSPIDIQFEMVEKKDDQELVLNAAKESVESQSLGFLEFGKLVVSSKFVPIVLSKLKL